VVTSGNSSSLETRPVETGAQFGERTEILSGLSEGEQVLVPGGE
jgi:multidrug efflux pump subunit AcrA (membrane-fusion protein)